MYHPTNRSDGKVLEFIELYNSNPYYEDISGFRLSGDIDYTFPQGTILAGAAFLAWSRLKEAPRPLEPGSSLPGTILWALSFLLLAGATVLWSPWLGSLAAITGPHAGADMAGCDP